jgi:hypothetical protein
MPFYIRKAFKFGPFRLNLSKSGVGTSVGVRGLRVGEKPSGQAYLHAGGGGLYIRENLGKDPAVSAAGSAVTSPAALGSTKPLDPLDPDFKDHTRLEELREDQQREAAFRESAIPEQVAVYEKKREADEGKDWRVLRDEEARSLERLLSVPRSQRPVFRGGKFIFPPSFTAVDKARWALEREMEDERSDAEYLATHTPAECANFNRMCEKTYGSPFWREERQQRIQNAQNALARETAVGGGGAILTVLALLAVLIAMASGMCKGH